MNLSKIAEIVEHIEVIDKAIEVLEQSRGEWAKGIAIYNIVNKYDDTPLKEAYSLEGKLGHAVDVLETKRGMKCRELLNEVVETETWDDEREQEPQEAPDI